MELTFLIGGLILLALLVLSGMNSSSWYMPTTTGKQYPSIIHPIFHFYFATFIGFMGIYASQKTGGNGPLLILVLSAYHYVKFWKTLVGYFKGESVEDF